MPLLLHDTGSRREPNNHEQFRYSRGGQRQLSQSNRMGRSHQEEGMARLVLMVVLASGASWAQLPTSTLTHVATNQVTFPFQLSNDDGAQIARAKVQVFPFGSLHPYWEQTGRDFSGVASYRNLGSNKCLDIETTFEGARVIQRPCTNVASQKWRIQCNAAQQCNLYNMAANRCLSASANWFFGLPVALTINNCDFTFNSPTQLWVGFT